MKKSKFLIAAIILSALVLQACGNGNSQPSDKDSSGAGGQAPATLNFGYVGGATELPVNEIGWGLHTGIIQEHLQKSGIETVNTTGFLTGPDLNESLISGRLDVGSSGDAPAINARAAGAKTRLLTQGSIKGRSIIISASDGPKSLAELAGKKVATVKGSAMHRLLLTVLKEGNIEAEVININSTADSVAALKRGEVDAIATVPYLLVVYEALQEGFNIVYDSRSNPDLASTGITVVSESYLEKIPDFPRVWNEARELAIKDLQAKPEAYYDWVAELTAAPREAVDQLYPIEDISGTAITDEGLRLAEIAKDFLVGEGIASADFDIQAWAIKE